jgi:hypothetical protein
LSSNDSMESICVSGADFGVLPVLRVSSRL